MIYGTGNELNAHRCKDTTVPGGGGIVNRCHSGKTIKGVFDRKSGKRIDKRDHVY